MPKYKYILFSAVIAGFLGIAGLSFVMTYPRYQKSTEQLPELITSDPLNINPALLAIRDQLDQYESVVQADTETLERETEAQTDSSQDMTESDDKSDNKSDSDSQAVPTEQIVWTGSVCASKYKTLSGSEKTYYVCPYIIAQTGSLQTEDASDWNLSLRFAVSALKDGELYEPDTNIQVKNIQFTFRVSEHAQIVSAGYGDGEMNDVNGKSVSYQFRDRDHINTESNIFARLSLTAVSAEDAGELPEETAINNWSFSIWENHHEIAVFDDVQIELPYLFSK